MLLLPLYPSNHNTLLQCCVLRGGLHYRRCGKRSQRGTEAVLENLGMGCDTGGAGPHRRRWWTL